MRVVSRILLLIIFMAMLIMAFTSCSAEWHLQKAQLKDPDIFKKDTVVERDTVYIASSQTDTVFIPGKDTVIIKEGKLTVKYYQRDSTVYLAGKCDKDTVIVDKIVERTVIEQKADKTWFYVSIGIAGMLILVVLKK